VLKIRGLGRIDVRLSTTNEVIVIEANPNPSLAREDDFAESARTAGIDYDALIQKILDAAQG
jgi:D-alanine-D-alanine ligase